MENDGDNKEDEDDFFDDFQSVICNNDTKLLNQGDKVPYNFLSSLADTHGYDGNIIDNFVNCLPYSLSGSKTDYESIVKLSFALPNLNSHLNDKFQQYPSLGALFDNIPNENNLGIFSQEGESKVDTQKNLLILEMYKNLDISNSYDFTRPWSKWKAFNILFSTLQMGKKSQAFGIMQPLKVQNHQSNQSTKSETVSEIFENNHHSEFQCSLYDTINNFEPTNSYDVSKIYHKDSSMNSDIRESFQRIHNIPHQYSTIIEQAHPIVVPSLEKMSHFQNDQQDTMNKITSNFIKDLPDLSFMRSNKVIKTLKKKS